MTEATAEIQRAAVIDCGTNMFTVLIAEGKGATWERKHVLRQPVFIGQGGFQNRSIRSDRFARGLDALQTFHQALGNYNVKHMRVVGTSALRDANNGTAFAEAIHRQFGWDMDIIGGEEEADWIFRGVAQTLTDALDRVLIMDIGGGSVEFVVAERNDAGAWQSKAALSLDAGVARLEEFGKPTDPLGAAGEERYRAFLENVMEPLEAVISEHQPTALVGSSGSFDTFAEAVNGSRANVPYLQRRDLESIDRQALQRLHRRLLTEPHEQRLKIPGMAPARAKMIPLSSMLLMHVLGKMDPTATVYRSPFAMREGLMEAVWQHLCTGSSDQTN
jgi:exopolyphosphatase/guanosine-5'-triphosphate,3'-diphosphate pyrophosphatase